MDNSEALPDPTTTFGRRVRERLSAEIVLWLTTRSGSGRGTALSEQTARLDVESADSATGGLISYEPTDLPGPARPGDAARA